MRLTRSSSAVMLAALFACSSPSQAASTTPRPNVLIILADDCTYNDLPVYGGQNAHTPNIDSLASQGLLFNHAYLCMSICQPCRSELYSGQFPLRNGCAWNHSASRPTTRSLPQYLGGLGYRVGIAGKKDVFPQKCFPFEDVPGFDGNCVDNPTKPHSLEGVKEFITRKQEQPFCLVVALVEPHVPWVMGDPSKYPPKEIKLPPNIADTPRTREDFGKYLAEITYMDGQVGEILATLKNAGLETNTLVLFTSEQGSQFPGNKWTCWDTGLHTGLIARWPGKVAAGKRTDALVEYADVAPTLVELAGGNPTGPDFTFDGTSFTDVLSGTTDTHRPLVYGIHDNLPEGSAYPSRTVSDGHWRYIRNLTPNELYIQRYLMGSTGNNELNNPYWGTWLFVSNNHPKIYQLVKRYMMRPPEELYDTSTDPYEMTNLIADPKLADIKTKLSAELDRWMAAQGDPGIPLDTHEALAMTIVCAMGGAETNLPAGVVPAMSRTQIEAGLKSHDHALFIKQGWIRDPYVAVGPDKLYYLTGTTPNPGDPREFGEPYNTGLGKESIVGSAVRVWRSKDLISWDYVGEPFTLERDSDRKNPGKILWAPELHWMPEMNRWALVHCPQAKANLAITAGPKLKGPWSHPLGEKIGEDKHDPSLFKDDDGTWWFIWKNSFIAPLSQDFTHFTAEPTRIDPAGSRTESDGSTLSRIGHEGTTILKIGKKYVFIGTGWSTDQGRKGSYNLYYCTADKITGPYGWRRFVGRFLGHGTPFQTLDGQWWCTAFYNANVPPLPSKGVEKRNLSQDAQTINQRGLTIVPLKVKIQDDGDVYMRAIDPAYSTPGPDEVQKFAD